MIDKKPIRAFLAVEIPPDIKDRIREIQRGLTPLVRDIRWTRPEGIHLTLKFFGNISEDDIPCISKVIERKTRDTTPLTLQVKTLGVFPGPSRPRVLWIGMQGEIDRLARLQGDIESGLQECGFQREGRRFTPHLTLGRAKSQKKMFTGIANILTDKGTYHAGQFGVGSLTLFKSELTPAGAVYTKLVRYACKD